MLGVPLQCEHDGLIVMVKKGQDQCLVTRLNEVIKEFSLSFVGRELSVEGGICAESRKNSLLQYAIKFYCKKVLLQ